MDVVGRQCDEPKTALRDRSMLGVAWRGRRDSTGSREFPNLIQYPASCMFSTRNGP